MCFDCDFSIESTSAFGFFCSTLVQSMIANTTENTAQSQN